MKKSTKEEIFKYSLNNEYSKMIFRYKYANGSAAVKSALVTEFKWLLETHYWKFIIVKIREVSKNGLRRDADIYIDVIARYENYVTKKILEKIYKIYRWMIEKWFYNTNKEIISTI